VHLKHCFYSNAPAADGKGGEDLYLNLVLEFIPETVYGMTKGGGIYSMSCNVIY
jgi:hypothetical protein